MLYSIVNEVKKKLALKLTGFVGDVTQQKHLRAERIVYCQQESYKNI